MISKIKYEYLLFIFALAWVLFFSFVLQLMPYFSTTSDDASYLLAAKLLYFEHKPDGIRPFLIAAIFGLPYFFKLSDNAVIHWGFFVNFCCWFLTILFLFKIIVTITNSRKKAFIYSLLFVFLIGNLAPAFRFLSESIFVFIVVLAIYFVSKYYANNDAKYLTIAISILILNALVKPISIGIAFIFIIFYISKIKNIVFNRYGFLLIFSLFLLLFQFKSMKKEYGDFTISYIGDVTYFNYLGAKAHCFRKNIEFFPCRNTRTSEALHLNFHDNKILSFLDMKEQLSNNKSNLVKAFLSNIYSNTEKGNVIVSQCKNVNQTSYFDFFQFAFKVISKLQNIIFTIATILFSFYFLWFERQNKYYLLMSIFTLYIFFVSAISCCEGDRFHIVFFPVLVIFLSKFKIKNPFAKPAF